MNVFKNKNKSTHTKNNGKHAQRARTHLKKEKPPNGEVLADVKIAQKTGLCLTHSPDAPNQTFSVGSEIFPFFVWISNGKSIPTMISSVMSSQFKSNQFFEGFTCFEWVPLLCTLYNMVFTYSRCDIMCSLGYDFIDFLLLLVYSIHQNFKLFI